MLNDVAGNPIYGWDSRGHITKTRYDELRRPFEIRVQGVEGYPTIDKVLVEKIIYGESQGCTKNHRGRIYQQFDAAGTTTNVAYDFKGNLLESSRQLTDQYTTQIDWMTPPEPTETFTSRTRYDALNRPIQLIAPHSDQAEAKINVIQPLYNEANLLEQVHVWLNQASEPIELLNPDTANQQTVANIDYDAKGQRTLIEYGNGARTEYEYDPETFRLTRLLTKRNAATFPDDCPSPPPEDWPGCEIQSLFYTYDPVGNITAIRDNAQQTIFFRNRRVEPSAEYTYDAIYRLIKATGREHLGQTCGVPHPPHQTNHDDAFRTNLPHTGDGFAMGNYTENYEYDAVGNILRLIHQAESGGWTRYYGYQEASLIEPDKNSNRLSRTSLPGDDPDGPYSAQYSYDEHGNMTNMPHLTLMQWDYKDQLQVTSKQVVNNGGTPEKTFYVYDAAGHRVRKVTESQADTGETPTRKNERIYLGIFEIYRKYENDGNAKDLERETLHIMDDLQRSALVEKRTKGNDGSPGQLIRYQFGNHLGSASLELDDQAQVISYEEYTPYGSTSYQTVDKELKAVAKRYRYTGKERDEESGFYYHGARYYAPWVGRWTASDPALWLSKKLKNIINSYKYANNQPIILIDKKGLQPGYPRAPEEEWIKQSAKQGISKKHAGKLLSTVGGFLNLPVTPSMAIAGKSLVFPSFKIGQAEITSKGWICKNFFLAPLTGPLGSNFGLSGSVGYEMDIYIPGEDILSKGLNIGRIHGTADVSYATLGFGTGIHTFQVKETDTYFNFLYGLVKGKLNMNIYGGLIEEHKMDFTFSGTGNLGLKNFRFINFNINGKAIGQSFHATYSVSSPFLATFSTGKLSYGSKSGFNISGHILGPTKIGVGWPSPDAPEEFSLDPEKWKRTYQYPSDPRRFGSDYLEMGEFYNPSIGFGYSYFQYSSENTLYLGIGFTPSSSYSYIHLGGREQFSLFENLGSYFGSYLYYSW
jgi:RHS repeat-associated protein